MGFTVLRVLYPAKVPPCRKKQTRRYGRTKKETTTGAENAGSARAKGGFALAGLIIFFGLLINSQSQKEMDVFEGQAEHENAIYTENNIICSNPYILDGDTLTCDGVRIRLYGIDAPEMPGHCKPGRRCAPGNPHKSKKYLQSLTSGAVVCQRIEIDHYGRTIARCTAQGQDVSCAMVAAKQAIRRYGNLTCP